MTIRNSDMSTLDIATVYDLMLTSAPHWQHSLSIEPSLEHVADCLSSPDTWVSVNPLNIPTGVATIITRLEGYSAELHLIAAPAYIRSLFKQVLGKAFEKHRIVKAELYTNQKQAIRLVEGMGFRVTGRDSYAAIANGKPVGRVLYELKRHEWRKNSRWGVKQHVTDKKQAAS
jgi:hypothetical protein